MKTRFLLIIAMAFFVSIIPAYAQELYFDPDFDFVGDDRFEKGKRYLIGDVVTITGHSELYDEKTDEHIPVPDSIFQVKIKDPAGEIVLNEEFVSDGDGDIEFSFLLSDDFKIGEYQVEMNVDKRQLLDGVFFVGHKKEMIVKTNSTFDLHTKEKQPVLQSFVDLTGKLCGSPMSSSSDDQTAFLLPHTGGILQRDSVQFLAEFTDPNGDKTTTSTHSEKDTCTEFSIGPMVNLVGVWSANVTAWWIEDETLYEASSDTIQFTVREPIFYSDMIEEIELDISSEDIILSLKDWHHDGNLILLQQYDKRLFILNLETQQIEALSSIPLELENGIGTAKFSYNDDFLYVQINEALWEFYPESKELVEVISDVANFDVLEDNRIMFSQRADKPLGETNYNLYIANADGTEPTLIHNDYDLVEFDANKDGTKVVFRNTLDSGTYWKERELEVLDVASGTTFVVPNVKQTCGQTPTLTPGNDMIIHHTQSCGRGWPGGVVHISTIDGSYTETIIPSSNYNPQFLLSPDGQSILTTSFGEQYSDAKSFYKITLAKPVPEFETLAVMILAISILPIILLQKFFRLRK